MGDVGLGYLPNREGPSVWLSCSASNFDVALPKPHNRLIAHDIHERSPRLGACLRPGFPGLPQPASVPDVT